LLWRFCGSEEIPGDGLPVCCDPAVAIDFSSVKELEEWVNGTTSLVKGSMVLRGFIMMITL